MIRSLDGNKPKIHPSVFVSEAAYIVGDVEIGEGSSIWPGAVIRGDYGKIIIGKNCSIQDNCVLHTDDYLELGDNVLMTHGAVIHGGTIGNNVLIGMNATVLDGATVGEGSIVAAGAVVLEGVEVPENTLVAGIPAREIRKTTPADYKRIMSGSEEYVQYSELFKKESRIL
ncbi:MAG: gamma carbonic anhydrase family protein [Candidatus Marinimicrobia bacterium]|nr:gamma carbonic anhydrase family protein [Candidatus Neomarinimicrobiota bacterium]